MHNEVDETVRRLFSSRIIINKESTKRAIYFHGYLLEQTLRIFDVSAIESAVPRMKDMTPAEIKRSLVKQILMMPKIIITKENLYSNNGISKR